MKVKVRYDGKLKWVIPLYEWDDQICLQYPAELFTLEDLKTACHGLPVGLRRELLGQYTDGEMFITFEREASRLPCIGKIQVASVDREVEWPE